MSVYRSVQVVRNLRAVVNILLCGLVNITATELANWVCAALDMLSNTLDTLIASRWGTVSELVRLSYSGLDIIFFVHCMIYGTHSGAETAAKEWGGSCVPLSRGVWGHAPQENFVFQVL